MTPNNSDGVGAVVKKNFTWIAGVIFLCGAAYASFIPRGEADAKYVRADQLELQVKALLDTRQAWFAAHQQVDQVRNDELNRRLDEINARLALIEKRIAK